MCLLNKHIYDIEISEFGFGQVSGHVVKNSQAHVVAVQANSLECLVWLQSLCVAVFVLVACCAVRIIIQFETVRNRFDLIGGVGNGECNKICLVAFGRDVAVQRGGGYFDATLVD